MADAAAAMETQEIRTSSGDVYTGEQLDGRPNGAGTLKLASGDHYEGQFKEGVRHG